MYLSTQKISFLTDFVQMCIFTLNKVGPIKVRLCHFSVATFFSLLRNEFLHLCVAKYNNANAYAILRFRSESTYLYIVGLSSILLEAMCMNDTRDDRIPHAPTFHYKHINVNKR